MSAGAKKIAGERFRKDVKNDTTKVSTNVINLLQNGVLRRDLFVIFWCMGPQGSQGRPKDPSDTLQSSKYLKKVFQNEVLPSDLFVIFYGWPNEFSVPGTRGVK